METRSLAAYGLILLCAVFLFAMLWRATSERRSVWRARRRYRRAKQAARDQMDSDPDTIRIVGRGARRGVAHAPDD